MTAQNQVPWLKIAMGVAVCELAGALATLWTLPATREWFPALIKPPWTPPSQAFAPIWIVLYALMGVAIGLVWAKNPRTSRERRAIGWFGLQLALSVAWCAVFFGARSPGWGYAIIIVLWLCVAATLWLFSKISRAAGWFLAPYLAFVTFASALNFAILSFNVVKPTVELMDKDPRNGPANQKPGASMR